MNNYVLIFVSSDGIKIETVDHDELISRITPDADGSTYYGKDITFLSEIPDKDPNYWPENSMIILKGPAIAPKPRQVVTQYDLD